MKFSCNSYVDGRRNLKLPRFKYHRVIHNVAKINIDNCDVIECSNGPVRIFDAVKNLQVQKKTRNKSLKDFLFKCNRTEEVSIFYLRKNARCFKLESAIFCMFLVLGYIISLLKYNVCLMF